MTPAEQNDCLMECVGNKNKLTMWEKGFVERQIKLHARVKRTENEIAVLVRLRAKLSGVANGKN